MKKAALALAVLLLAGCSEIEFAVNGGHSYSNPQANTIGGEVRVHVPVGGGK